MHYYTDIFAADIDLLVHQVNCHGVMGAGIALQIRRRWPQVYEFYRSYCEAVDFNVSALLGTNQYVKANLNKKSIIVVNALAQGDYGRNGCFTNYDAMRKCFRQLRDFALGREKNRARSRIGIPYGIGCVLGGGDWSTVLSIIEEELGDCDVWICKKT